MSWMLLAAAAVATLLLVAAGSAVFVILAGGGMFLLRRRASPPVSFPAPAVQTGAPTSVPDSEEARTVQVRAEARRNQEPPKSLPGFPSLPPSGRLPLPPPEVPSGLRSVSPLTAPPPSKKTGGLLGFFDEPFAQPGEAAKTELFQRGKVPDHWDEEVSEGAEATEIFSALNHETGDEGFVEDDSTARGAKP